MKNYCIYISSVRVENVLRMPEIILATATTGAMLVNSLRPKLVINPPLPIIIQHLKSLGNFDELLLRLLVSLVLVRVVLFGQPTVGLVQVFLGEGGSGQPELLIIFLVVFGTDQGQLEKAK